MPLIRRGDEGTAMHIVGSALLTAAGILLCRIIFGEHLGNLTLTGALLSAAVAFLLVATCALVGGRWGFLLLWVLLLVAWGMILIRTLTDARGEPFASMVLLPDGFVAWSMAALPFALATRVAVRTPRSRTSGTVVAGGIAWLALLAANSFLARYAPDVGSTPRQQPVVVSLVAVLSILAPFLVSSWFIRQLRTPKKLLASP
jgi:hypothetical protein